MSSHKLLFHEGSALAKGGLGHLSVSLYLGFLYAMPLGGHPKFHKHGQTRKGSQRFHCSNYVGV